jgi:hypothetical protein
VARPWGEIRTFDPLLRRSGGQTLIVSQSMTKRWSSLFEHRSFIDVIVSGHTMTCEESGVEWLDEDLARSSGAPDL